METLIIIIIRETRRNGHKDLKRSNKVKGRTKKNK